MLNFAFCILNQLTAMNKTLNNVLISLNTLVFAGSLLWMYYDFDFEPILTASGLFITLITLVLVRNREELIPHIEESNKGITNEINVVTNINNGNNEEPILPMGRTVSKEDLLRRKKLTNVLFVDDDTKFKIIKILNKVGWKTKIVKDIDNLDSDVVLNAHILFVDIQGVGISLGFKDEGLGLANSLKKKYPEKKIIIYSTESTGDRFHEALRNVDSFLSKNAEPIEFQELIEQYSAEFSL